MNEFEVPFSPRVQVDRMLRCFEKDEERQKIKPLKNDIDSETQRVRHLESKVDHSKLDSNFELQSKKTKKCAKNGI
jgi:hypothetical protein